MADLFSTATEYLANELTFTRGSIEDILSVGVYHTTDPDEVPAPEDFTTVDLVGPGDPLADGNKVDVLSLIGPKDGSHDELAPGVHHRWVYVETASEDIIRRAGTVTVTGPTP